MRTTWKLVLKSKYSDLQIKVVVKHSRPSTRPLFQFIMLCGYLQRWIQRILPPALAGGFANSDEDGRRRSPLALQVKKMLECLYTDNYTIEVHDVVYLADQRTSFPSDLYRSLWNPRTLLQRRQLMISPFSTRRCTVLGYFPIPGFKTKAQSNFVMRLRGSNLGILL